MDNIDLALKGNLYGGSDGNESTVDTDVADAADEDGRSPGVVFAESGSSIRKGVGACVDGDSTLVARGLRAGLLNLVADRGLCVLRNVFLAVGDVADSVSNLRLVDPLPYTGSTFVVFNDNLGRFEGDGPTVGIAS